MRRRRGARGAHGLLHRLARHVSGAERSDRPSLRDRQERGRSEQVLLRWAHELGDAAPVAASNAHATDERRRDPRGLAHHQTARRRHLVGQRHDGRLQLATVVVGRPAEVDERRDPRAADRRRSRPRAARPAERVRDHDRHLDAQPLGQRLAEPLGRPVRILRATTTGTPPRRSTRRRRRSRRRSRGASRRSPGRLDARRPARVSRSTHASRPSPCGTTRPSALDTIFWVTATTSPSRTPIEPSGSARSIAEIVPRANLREPLEREDLDAHGGDDARSSEQSERDASERLRLRIVGHDRVGGTDADAGRLDPGDRARGPRRR